MRASGILMPVFSLASPYGIGTFGAAAYEFADFLALAGQRYWQILPLCPTDYGHSPYQTFCSAAGNPYFIDLEILCRDGLLTKEECEAVPFGTDRERVDYRAMETYRLPLLFQAFLRFDQTAGDYRAFLDEQEWVGDYALFMALKERYNDAHWRDWPEPLRTREPSALSEAARECGERVAFYCVLQYWFFRQWEALKRYANQKGVLLFGDMPIYVSDNSVDVWCHTEQYELDTNLRPRRVAGCPPDAFCEDGQRWGMPLYDWEKMEADGFRWWIGRMRRALQLYDVVRIDHFRAFAAYYAIDAAAASAKDGVWVKGPGMKLFRALEKACGKPLPIVAENLGHITDDVRRLLADSGFPGMAVLQFAFDGDPDNEYLPHRLTRNTVVYTGTHDNDTVVGWVAAEPQKAALARRYFHVDDKEGFHWAMIRGALASVADTAILCMQDFMGLDNRARINTPATVGDNWSWRIAPGCVNDWLAGIIRENVILYGRLPMEEKA